MSAWLLAVGCGVAYWRGSWRVFALWLIGWSLWAACLPSLLLRIQQRVLTYQAALSLSWEHPWAGVGAGPLALPKLCQVSGMPLPGPHSDWLALILLHGWPAALLAFFLTGWLLSPRRSGKPLAIQACLLTLTVAAAIRSVVVHPGYVLALVACSVYLLKEQTCGSRGS